MKIYCWTVDGINAKQKRKGFLDWLDHEQPDVLVAMRTLAQPEKLPDALRNPPGYASWWHGTDYQWNGGIGLLSRIQPRKVQLRSGIRSVDKEGRTVVAEYDKFTLIFSQFVIDQRFRSQIDRVLHLADRVRATGRPVIIGGDLRVPHRSIDTSFANRWSRKVKRNWIDVILEEGYVDIFRKLHPKKEGAFTYWHQRHLREKNQGDRWHMIFISPELQDKVQAADIHAEVELVHRQCPVSLTLALPVNYSNRSQASPAKPPSARRRSIENPELLPKRNDSAGYVYILHDVDHTGYYKIGSTNYPPTRLRRLGVLLPFEPKLELILESKDRYGLEGYLHDRYADLRKNGEWFALTDDHLTEIEDMARR